MVEMAVPEEKTSVAVLRKDALDHADPLKAQISLALRADTPVICLACTNSNRMGDNCTKGLDIHGQVDNLWKWASDPETPLLVICPLFNSVRAIHRGK
jgi:hypothetical protein